MLRMLKRDVKIRVFRGVTWDVFVVSVLVIYLNMQDLFWKELRYL